MQIEHNYSTEEYIAIFGTSFWFKSGKEEEGKNCLLLVL